MPGMFRIDGVQFEVDALLGERRVHPAGHFGLREGIADGRQVDEVDAILIGELPRVGVAEYERLDVIAALQERPELGAVGRPLYFLFLSGSNCNG